MPSLVLYVTNSTLPNFLMSLAIPWNLISLHAAKIIANAVLYFTGMRIRHGPVYNRGVGGMRCQQRRVHWPLPQLGVFDIQGSVAKY